MVDEILPNLYRIEIPLPRNPLRALNSYLIKAPGRFMLIDTGMNREECLRAMTSGLKELDVDLRRTDFFITHLHSDHLGLVSSLATDTSKVYFNHREATTIYAEEGDKEGYWQKFYGIYVLNGFPEDELKVAAAGHPGRRFGLRQHVNFSTVNDGDTIEIGDYSFRCVETPGHSPGHMCLYEPNKKLLIAGDHILFDITPNITCWQNMPNSLKHYLLSLDKVYALDVNLVLPGHRSIMPDHRKRIRELKAHHRARLDEVLSALEKGDKNAFQVAPYVTWDIDCASWEKFPVQQKWFAFGETLAHLYYLEEDGMIKRKTGDHLVVFSLV